MKIKFSLKCDYASVIEKLTFMSQNRNKFLQDKEHRLLDIQFRKGNPAIHFSSGRISSYWDFIFCDQQLTVKRRVSAIDLFGAEVSGAIDLFVLFVTRNIAGLCLFLILVLFEVGPFYLIERFYVQPKIKKFVVHYLSDYS